DGREAVRRLERIALHVAPHAGVTADSAEVCAGFAARPGDSGAQVFGEGARTALCGLSGAGRRPAPLAGRQAGAGTARWEGGEAGALGAAQAGRSWAGDGGDGGSGAAGGRGRGDMVLVGGARRLHQREGVARGGGAEQGGRNKGPSRRRGPAPVRGRSTA